MEITPIIAKVFNDLGFEVSNGSDYTAQIIIEAHDLRTIVQFNLPHVKRWALELLYLTISNNRPNSLELLLIYGFDPNVPEVLCGMTPPLWAAIYSDEAELFRILVIYGADVNQRFGQNAYTPLHAVMKMTEHRELTELLLSRGVDVNAEDSDGLTAIHHAISAGVERVPTIRYLVEHGAWVCQGREPPLLLAMQLRNPELAGFLIQKFYDAIKMKDFTGMSALHYTAMTSADNSETAKMLIRLGLDVNEKDDMNRTPLHLAASARNLSMAKFLLDNGANVDAKTCGHVTPLMSAASIEKGSVSVANLLMRKGANVNWSSKDTTTALLRACSMKNVDIARALIEAGADQTTVIGRKFLEFDKSIQSMFLKYAAKLHVAGHPIDSRLKEHLQNRIQLVELFDEYTNELRQMNLIHVHGRKSIFDILVASRTRLLVYFKNPHFVAALEQGVMLGNWDKYFPIYGPEVVRKYGETQFQFKARTIIEETLIGVFYMHLPDMIVSRIVSHSNIEDLRELLPQELKSYCDLYH